MLSKSFKSAKCKTSLKLGISRIKLLKNRRDVQLRQLRKELARLLQAGQEQTARIRVEHVIREEKTMSAYDLIEIYCELIVARMPIIESQKGCPIDLKEAISSVIFASPRCADIPELADVRKQFVVKYGKEFVTSALELRPDCGVNRMIVEKLSANTPDIDTKMKTLTAIAKEHEIKWDSKAFEQEQQKPQEDLLNGSSSHINVNLFPDTSRTEPASKVYQTDIPTKTTSFGSTSQANLKTTSLAPKPASNESRESDGKASVSEVKFSHPKEDTASFKQPTWKMEFKDAASAAQAAAESAERASIAARAAAKLASRDNMSRQNSNEPNASFLHSSKMKSKINESVNMEYDEVKGFQGMKEEMQKPPKHELRDEISYHSSTSDEDIEYSSQTNNVRKFDSFRQSFSRMEMGNEKKHEEAGFVEKNVHVNYDDEIWSPPIDQHQFSNNHDNLLRYDSNKEHDSSDYPAAVFDEYDPEPTDHKENLFDSFEKRQNDQPSIFAPSTSTINPNFFSGARVTVEKIPSSKFDDNLSVAFDDSDGLTSESDDDDDISSSRQNGTAQNSNLQRQESRLGRDSHSQEKLQSSILTTTKPLFGSEEKNHLLSSSSSVSVVEDSEMPDELAIGGEFGLKFGRLTGGLKNRGYNRPPYPSNSSISQIEKDLSSQIMSSAPPNLQSDKAKASLSQDYNQGSSFQYTDKSEEDNAQEKSKQYKGSDPNLPKQFTHDSTNHDEKPRTKAYKELSSRMSSTTDFDSDAEDIDSLANMESQANASSTTSFKLSRRTKDSSSKGPNLPRSTNMSSADIGSRQGKPNQKTSKLNSSSESLPEISVHEENNKTAGGIPDSDTTNYTNSLNNKPSDSSVGETKLPQIASNKASHVHPKLPDYETLAAHFHSLRSNKR